MSGFAQGAQALRNGESADSGHGLPVGRSFLQELPMTVEKRKALGRGLETLLPPRHVPHAPVSTTAPARAHGDEVHHIPLDQLEHNPYQTRSSSPDPVALAELAASIKAVGVLQPIVVRPVSGGHYQVIAGERRWQASQSMGLPTIPAIVRHVSNEQAMEMTIIENLQREDLNPMEQARAFERLGREFGLTQEQIAQRTGKERSSVANYLRLLKLPPAVQTMMEKNLLSLGHGKALMGLESPEEIERLARRINEQALSVRQTEDAVARMSQPPAPRAEKERILDPNVREAEKTLERSLGVRVTINDRKGKGRILIEYSSLEDFDRIMEALGRK
ncbi:MAG TPA: ParB/RepB/Spo0J family partition protein [Candidatus Binatia bacterium]|nr:ParB/RepB/Spo0J family partition protein [Candidatus Binatia bacterium]